MGLVESLGGFQGLLPPRALGEKGMEENAPKIRVRSALSRSIALLNATTVNSTWL